MIWLLILFFISSFSYCIQPYKAVVITPVVDLFSTPLPEKELKDIPLCGGQKNPFVACKRGHQLLFHEIVDVVDQTNHHACIEIPNIFYIALNQPDKKYHRYWVEKKHLVPIENIDSADLLPHPVSFEQPYHREQEVILIDPHEDTATHLSLSVGTRFIKRINDDQKENDIPVWILDPKSLQSIASAIPSQKCYEPKGKSISRRIADFVRIVQKWAHYHDSYIPYVWGGCSSVNRAHSSKMQENVVQKDGLDASYYTIHDYTAQPMTGFDCSSLISRAAQICNIPYFYKNTTTLAYFLKPVNHTTPIENGDLIWIPWHVMIISDVKNNKLVEARSYSHGYGKVHEIPLHKVFKGICTYDDLKYKMLAHETLERIDIHGAVMDTFKTFKILKLKSVFNDANLQSL